MSLVHRYEEICYSLGLRPHEEIEHSLANINRSSHIIPIHANQSNKPLGDDDIKPIAILVKEFRDKIFRIRFTGQKISDKGASVIASLFQVTGNIESVNLAFNEIKDEGAGAFGASFASSQTLPSVFDLSGNPVSDEGISLLLRGFSIRLNPARLHSVHLRLNDTHATVACEGAVIDGLHTGLFASLIIAPVTDGIRAVAFETGTNLVECDVTSLQLKMLELEEACAFPATHDAKLKRIAGRISELEKKLQDSEERERALNKRVVFLEESFAREQDSCVKLLKQCQKIINQSN